MAEAKPKNLAEALIAFQASVPTIHENSSSFHGKFADLPGILSTIGPALRKSGLAVSQVHASIDGKPGLKTTLMHTSGDAVTDVTPLCIQEGVDGRGKPLNVTQEWGKASTYTRRHSLLAILNLAIGIEDNDADAEPQVRSVPTPKQEQQAPKPSPSLTKKASQVPPSPELPKDKLDALLAQLKGLDSKYMTTMCKAFIPKFNVPNGVKVGAFIKTQEHSEWITNYLLENEP